MADNIRRAMQDTTLGSEDPPFVLPAEVVRQAEEENRFILVGRPVMPRRQNIRALLATMPRNWGFEGLVRGRVIEGRRFQFVFPSEESMDMVIRREPWAFADRMIVLQRQVIVNIARLLGEYIQMDYSEEIGSRLEYVRVRLNWNINHPLRFQRNFQFVPGVNTLLRLQYERLCGFCEVCGLITHDSGACLIQNGGPGNDDGAHNGDDDIEIVPNQEPVIEEEHPVQDEYERNIRTMEEEVDEEPPYEMYNPLSPNGQPFPREMKDETGLKRKEWLSDANENTMRFSKGERGESSGSSKAKRKKNNEVESGDQVTHDGTAHNDSNLVRGAVGPEPPLPP
ncbi:hypothetical protein BRARA_B03206 [Brassica rapa]|uniref:DUF4283 domain-containing protein n=1 Tax=Brassica campestris TaxID=3711 RepID=A0A398ALI9_BRACM|nr:hypothetical protein BRARA_B03206 [Brassica rapa]